MANGTQDSLKEVTDPSVLNQLNTEVTDPNVLAQLEGKPQEPSLKDAFSPMMNLWTKGVSQMKSNPIAGAINLYHSILQAPSAAFGTADYFLQKTPDKVSPLVDVAKVASKGLSGLQGWAGGVVNDVQDFAEKKLDDALSEYGFPEESKTRIKNIALSAGANPTSITASIASMGLNSDQLKEVNEALSGVNKTYGQYAALPLLSKGLAETPKTIGAVARTVIPESAPLRLVSSAYRQPFVKSKGIKGFEEPAKIALNKELPPNHTSLDEVTDVRSKLAEIRNRTVTQRAGEGASVNYNRQLRLIQDLRKQAKGSLLEKETSAALDEAEERVSNRLKEYPNGKVPLDVADQDHFVMQDLVNNKYGEIGTVKQEVYKSLARNLLESLIEQEPSLKALGREQGQMKVMQRTLEKTVATLDASEIGPKGWLVRLAMRGAAGAAVGGIAGGSYGIGLELGAAEAVAELLIRDPQVKFHLGVLLDRVRKMGLKPTKTVNDFKPTMGGTGAQPQRPTGGSEVPPRPQLGAPPSSTATQEAQFEDIKPEQIGTTSNLPVKVEKYKLQGQNKGINGEVHSNEYIITDPNSPAYNANFTVKPGESVEAKYKQTEERFKK
jgi:hypothetical protein